MFADIWDWSLWDWFLEDTKEVKQKRKELIEAKEKALEKRRQEHAELSPLGLSLPLPLFQLPSEEKFREAVEKYRREHPEEEVRGVAIDRDNLIYRALQVHRRIEEKEKKDEVV